MKENKKNDIEFIEEENSFINLYELFYYFDFQFGL